MPFGIDEGAGVIVQGITGHQGRLHTAEMLAFGTRIVGGTSPGKAGQMVSGVPVFNDVASALGQVDAQCSVIFVPAAHCRDAVVESIEAGIGTTVAITEHVPIQDTMWLRRYASKRGVRLIGPNSPGICIPGAMKLGIMPNMIFKRGRTAVISRSGTLTYEVVASLTEHGIGQRMCVGIGGDKVVGTSMAEVVREMLLDDELDSMVLVGEIGGSAEQDAAKVYAEHPKVPLLAFIAGRTAPPDKRMGHAGAIISGISGTYDDKVRSLESHGIGVCRTLKDIPSRLVEITQSM